MAPRRYHRTGDRKISDEEILRLYVEEGMDGDSIGYLADCSGTTARDIVRRQGGVLRRRAGLPADYARKVSDEDVIRRYQAGETGRELAAEAGCSMVTIYRILSLAGVPRRPAHRSFRGIVRQL
jgi:hypothetical protein